jgi:hypothetical protein
MNIDIVEELLDDDAFDPKKLFNEEEYSTLLIKRDGFSKSQNSSADLLEALLEPNVTRAECEVIFSKLKDANANDLMLDAITCAERIEEKTLLTAACWESGLDFTNHFLFFVELACHDDFKLAMEALTVVENVEGMIDENTLTKALEFAQNAKSKNEALISELIKVIKERVN